MEEEKTKLYGECAYVLNRLTDKFCENDRWDHFINHLCSLEDWSFETERDLYHYYKYLVFLFWRTRNWDGAQPFNQVSKKQVLAKVDGKPKTVDGYTIHNYDYKMFLWAIKNGHTYGINPTMIDVAEEELTPAELKRFEKKAEENKNV